MDKLIGPISLKEAHTIIQNYFQKRSAVSKETAIEITTSDLKLLGIDMLLKNENTTIEKLLPYVKKTEQNKYYLKIPEFEPSIRAADLRKKTINNVRNMILLVILATIIGIFLAN